MLSEQVELLTEGVTVKINFFTNYYMYYSFISIISLNKIVHNTRERIKIPVPVYCRAKLYSPQRLTVWIHSDQFLLVVFSVWFRICILIKNKIKCRETEEFP